MSNSVWPHRWQPTRLPRPWDSPGNNTGVCCHFVLQWVKVKRESEVAQLCPTLSDPMDCSLPGSSIHGIFQAKLLEWVAIAFSALKRTTPFYGNPSHPSQRVLFLPPSDAYVRSFFYLLYTLIKLYYTKALSNQASSLAPDWILLLRGPRIPVSSRDSKTTFHLGGSSGILQDKVRMLGALGLCSLGEHVFCCALLTLRCACVNEWHALREASKEPCSAVPRLSHMAYGRNLSGRYTDLPMPRGTQCLLRERPEMDKACGRTLLSRSNFSVSLTIS